MLTGFLDWIYGELVADPATLTGVCEVLTVPGQAESQTLPKVSHLLLFVRLSLPCFTPSPASLSWTLCQASLSWICFREANLWYLANLISSQGLLIEDPSMPFLSTSPEFTSFYPVFLQMVENYWHWVAWDHRSYAGLVTCPSDKTISCQMVATSFSSCKP